MLSFSKYRKLQENRELESDLFEFEQQLKKVVESKKPASKKERSNLVKRAKRGEDIFGGGKNFKKIAGKAGKKYGSKEAGERVAAAIMWKKAGKKGMVAEQLTASDLLYIFDEDLGLILK